MKQTRKNKKILKLKPVYIKVFVLGLLSLISLFALFILLVRIGAFGKLPNEIELKQIRNNTATEIISVDNELLGRYYYQNRTNAKLEEIPTYLINALIATEDVRFYEHSGVDFRSTMRVLVKSVLLANKSAGGGSTISQQLAKNLYPRKNYGILTMPVAKIKEIIIAKRIEKINTKNEILELYLNTVSFGENTYGIETAALVYFSKEPNELSIEESALLVGLLKANTSYNPHRNITASTNRRNTVLKQMAKYNYLSLQEADSLIQAPVKLHYRRLTTNEGLAPYFREHLRSEIVDILSDIKKVDGSEYNLYSDGLKIYTTVNYNMQKFAEEAAKEHLSELQDLFDKHWKNREPWKKDPNLALLQIKQSEVYKNLRAKGLSHDNAIEEMKNPRETSVFNWETYIDTTMSPLDSILFHFKILQTGMLVMNPKNGDILAWIGGDNYKYFKYDHVLAMRQAGSIFKPFVYATALENGISPCSFYANDSIVYEGYDNWTPQNADNEYGGFYSVKGALANSVNTVSTKLILEVGIDKTIDLAHKMGISSDLPHVPSLALGTGEVSLYDIVKSYCVFDNGGRTVQPRIIRRIENSKGQVIYSNSANELGDSVLSSEVAKTMVAMMQGTVDRGTAHSLRTVWGLSNELAGKTGTTQNQTDGWFVCITPNLVIGTWVGGDSPVVRFRSLTYGQGGYMALPITARFLKKLYNDQLYRYLKTASFNIPEEVYVNLDCEDFDEDGDEQIIDFSIIKEEGIGEFIKNIFGRKKKRKNNSEELEEN
jgi:penicillin-binding protein 1A